MPRNSIPQRIQRPFSYQLYCPLFSIVNTLIEFFCDTACQSVPRNSPNLELAYSYSVKKPFCSLRCRTTHRFVAVWKQRRSISHVPSSRNLFPMSTTHDGRPLKYVEKQNSRAGFPTSDRVKTYRKRERRNSSQNIRVLVETVGPWFNNNIPSFALRLESHTTAVNRDPTDWVVWLGIPLARVLEPISSCDGIKLDDHVGGASSTFFTESHPTDSMPIASVSNALRNEDIQQTRSFRNTTK